MESPNTLPTVRERAAHCRASDDYVRARIRSGEPHALRVGRRFRVSVATLEAFLESRVVVRVAPHEVAQAPPTHAPIDLPSLRCARNDRREEIPRFHSTREALAHSRAAEVRAREPLRSSPSDDRTRSATAWRGPERWLTRERRAWS